MNAKDKLLNGGYIEDNYAYDKYSGHFDTIYNSVVDYGYVDRVVPAQEDNPNILYKDTERFMAVRVQESKKEEFEGAMKDLNVYMGKEKLKQSGEEHDFYMFKLRNLPELGGIIRGCVKIKQQEMAMIRDNKVFKR